MATFVSGRSAALFQVTLRVSPEGLVEICVETPVRVPLLKSDPPSLLYSRVTLARELSASQMTNSSTKFPYWGDVGAETVIVGLVEVVLLVVLEEVVVVVVVEVVDVVVDVVLVVVRVSPLRS